MSRALIVGMGIGNLYHEIYKNKGWEIVTIDSDPNKHATYQKLDDVTGTFDIAHICTPNFLHQNQADFAASISKIVFVEKPGLYNKDSWVELTNKHPNTRIAMVKNNMFRKEMQDLVNECNTKTHIQLNWINDNRIPNPGSWFTDKNLAWGGVSRDLLPHLLSIFVSLSKEEHRNNTILEKYKEQRWKLDDLINTDYGSINLNGVYNVDDIASIRLSCNDKEYTLTANWKSDTGNDRAIHMFGSNQEFHYELGLCPEEAYEKMIDVALHNIDDNDFWIKQLDIDSWIHEIVELFA